MTGVSIRALAEDDEADWRRLWQAYQDFYEVSFGEETTAATFRRLLDPTAPYGGFVAESGGAIVGIANYVLHPDTWSLEPYCYLNDLYVEEARRGGGIGRALIAAVRARAEELGSPLLWWLTAADNTRAQALYDQLATLDTFRRYEVKLTT